MKWVCVHKTMDVTLFVMVTTMMTHRSSVYRVNQGDLICHSILCCVPSHGISIFSNIISNSLLRTCSIYLLMNINFIRSLYGSTNVWKLILSILLFFIMNINLPRISRYYSNKLKFES